MLYNVFVDTINEKINKAILEIAEENGFEIDKGVYGTFCRYLSISQGGSYISGSPSLSVQTSLKRSKITLASFIENISEKIVVVTLNDNYKAEIHKDCILVGCQKFDRKTCEELYFAISDVMNPIRQNNKKN